VKEREICGLCKDEFVAVTFRKASASLRILYKSKLLMLNI